MADSNQIWNEIKNLPIDMFSLPNQKVEKHVSRLSGTADQVYLRLSSPAALPALESVLATQKLWRKERIATSNPHHEPEFLDVSYPKYTLEESDAGYVIVSRFIPPKDREELQKGEFFVSGKAPEPPAPAEPEPKPEAKPAPKATRKTTRKTTSRKKTANE